MTADRQNGTGGAACKHLFVINPAAKRISGGKARRILREKITAFFDGRPDIPHEVYESRWCRDSVAFIRQYVSESAGRVRVHALGGNGTFFEAVNGVVGLDNAEVAVYTYGRGNDFARYFDRGGGKPFLSLENQVFGRTIPIDVIRCGNNYGASFGMAGIEAYANALGNEWRENYIPTDMSYTLAAMYLILNGRASQNYRINIDGRIIEGDFVSVLAANAPCYGVDMYPAIDAHPNDGWFDVYTFKKVSKAGIIASIPIYTHGGYRKLPKVISHYRAKNVKLTSNEVMCMSVDGENFYGTSVEYEIMPGAVKVVCPDSIDVAKLPRIYGKRGRRGE
ncbi:hypothetical protein R80B4_01585 [Fibrobacteres bacterium R8-0-B4]